MLLDRMAKHADFSGSYWPIAAFQLAPRSVFSPHRCDPVPTPGDLTTWVVAFSNDLALPSA